MDQFMIRLTTLSQELNDKMQIRPTIQYTKKAFADFDKKIETISANYDMLLEEINRKLESHENELKMHS